MDERPTFTVPGPSAPGKLRGIFPYSKKCSPRMAFYIFAKQGENKLPRRELSPLSAVSVPPRRYHFVPLQSGVGCTAFAAKRHRLSTTTFDIPHKSLPKRLPSHLPNQVPFLSIDQTHVIPVLDTGILLARYCIYSAIQKSVNTPGKL